MCGYRVSFIHRTFRRTAMLCKLPFIAALLSLASCTSAATTPQEPHAPAPPPAPVTAPATQPATPPAPGQPPAPAPAPAPAPGAVDPAIDALLTRQETSAADLTSFTAKIAYEKEDAMLGRREIRTGEIIYRIEADKKSFAVLLDQRVIIREGAADGRLEEGLYHYIFDGRWLAEVNHESKQFIKREIVPPGKSLDPLKLGEGPFPLPVGQPKADVLARFEVSKIDVPKDGMLKTLQNVDGVLLKPKPGTREAEDYQRVEIFYDRDTLLPVGINAIEINDDRKTVKLTEMKRNPPLDEAMLKKLDIAEPDPKQWDIDVRPWTE
jgi:hypothetical protein